MKKVFFVFGMMTAFSAVCEERLLSDIKPTDGFHIRNAHKISPKVSYIFRGMAPDEEEITGDLAQFGVTDLLDIDWTSADAPSWDVDSPYNPKNEKAVAALHGYKFVEPEDVNTALPDSQSKRFYIIPTMWDNLDPFAENCKTYLKVLRVLKAISEDPTHNRKIYFHCTVGEDRTGVVAALYRILTESLPLKDAFTEMCRYGYEAGDPKKSVIKPDDNAFERVVVPIRKNLTPFFLKMVYKIDHNEITWDKLSDDACAEDPDTEEDFVRYDLYKAEIYTCKTSELALPL